MIQDCSRLGIKNIFAVLLEVNLASEQLLIQTGFEKWGFLPKIADLNGKICGQFIYGMNF
jgi:phosphinothricin acetyltransferase